MSGDPFWARVMTVFIKTCILQRLNWVTTTVEESVKNYVEWYFQSAQRLNFLVDFKQEFYVIGVEDDLFVFVSVEDDFGFFMQFGGWFLWFHTLDTPLQTQTHTQACGGGGGGGGGHGGGGG